MKNLMEKFFLKTGQNMMFNRIIYSKSRKSVISVNAIDTAFTV